VVTVPESDGDMLRNVIGNAGGGKVGSYSHSSFTIKGIGRFIPQTGAQPAIGSVGKSEEVVEERIEVNCDEVSLELVLKVIRDNHPYEEPVIDVYPLLEL
jgi:hypothetical protein